MNSSKYEIPQQHLTVAIEGLQYLAHLDGQAAKQMAETRLKQAKVIRESADFFLHL